MRLTSIPRRAERPRYGVADGLVIIGRARIATQTEVILDGVPDLGFAACNAAIRAVYWLLPVSAYGIDADVTR